MRKTPVIAIFLIALLLAPTALSLIHRGARTMIDVEASVDYVSLAATTSIENEAMRILLQFASELTPLQVRIAETSGIEFVRRGSSVVHVGRIYSAKVSSADSLLALTDLGLLRVASGEKRFYPSLISSVPVTNAPLVWENLKKNGTSIDGTGIRVAVIDTGAAWLHPAFWKPSTGNLQVIQEGPEFYADLDNDSAVDLGEGPICVVEVQNIGTTEASNEYMYIDINDDGSFEYGEGDRWLGGYDSNDDGVISLPSEKVALLGESKVAVLYDQDAGSVYVRGVNLTSQALSVGDTNGHGTHVASTIAGGQIGYTSMLGMAPGADLIIIKSPLESSDIIDGIHFAIEQGADVINMSFSSFLGFLDGTDIEDLAVSEAFMENGTVSVLASGNLAGYSKHARYAVSGGASDSAILSVSSPPQYSFLNILWHSYDDDEEITLTSPGGDPIDLGTFSDIMGSSYQIDREELKAYLFAEKSIRGTNQIIVQVSTTEHEWASGSWSVSLSNPSGDEVDVNLYVWDNSWGGGSLRFSSKVDNSRTLSSPSTADLGIAVASYDEGGSISTSSGRGPRIDGVAKVDIAAPGVNILAARNSLTSLWTSKSGTSMAAPHVSGLVALVKQVSGSKLGWLDLSAVLQGAGGLDSHYSPADASWGYGLCDAVRSIRQVLEIEIGSSLADWTGVPVSRLDPEDSLVPAGLDIRYVYSYQLTDRLVVAIVFRDAPDYSGTNKLFLGWDTDSDNMTGADGVNLLVEVTNGTVSVGEWSGTEYEASSTQAGYWNESNSGFVWVERTSSSVRGDFVVNSFSASSTLEDGVPETDLSDQWRVLASDLIVEMESDNVSVHLTLFDLDSADTELAVWWTVVDGALSTLQSEINTGVRQSHIVIDFGSIVIGDVVSVLTNVTDATGPFYLPLVGLFALDLDVHIVSAALDQNVVSVGLFINEVISGSIVVEGYVLVEQMDLALESESGRWFNVTLNGDVGEYSFEMSTAGFTQGQYEVFAVVTTRTDSVIEYHFDTLEVIENNAALFLLVTVGIVGIVIITIRSRVKSKSHTETGG